MKTSKKFLIALVVLILAGIYYYVSLPAVNIHSSDTWFFLLGLLVVLLIVYIFRKKIKRTEFKESKIVKTMFGIIVIMGVVYFAGSILSSPIVNAKKYQQLMSVEKGKFTEDIQEVSYDKIPLLDKETAEILGDRKMGSMVDMVSQFDADDIYSQINYQGRPVRVSPLRYASPVKWLMNQKDGIPAYLMIDMANQNTELIKLKKGIRYSKSEYFNRNIYRHLRFAHPTYIYGELSFELDEEGTPYWVAPVKKFNIGLFGGETVGRIVLCNAITGETKDYKISDVPEWIDKVYSPDLLVELFDYHGTLKHGFINSVLTQKDCLKSTNGYNYLVQDDDVWMYTGVTSVTGDRSNVGFVLSNQRTMETKYYEVEGATEEAAMESAEGQVQNLHYSATFPLLLNISGEPTYFVALKDDAGLVKKYAMVNVHNYQTVAIGDSVSQCEENYQGLLLSSGLKEEEKDTREVQTITGLITKIAQGVIEGNSHYYIMVEGSDEIFDVPVVDYLDIIKYEVGQEITMEYKNDEKSNIVLSIK